MGTYKFKITDNNFCLQGYCALNISSTWNMRIFGLKQLPVDVFHWLQYTVVAGYFSKKSALLSIQTKESAFAYIFLFDSFA